MTLYVFTKDTPNTSTCTGTCEVVWMPLLTSGPPVAGTGVDASLLGTITRQDGTKQVTYNGRPLYRWFRDQKAGDTTGQGIGNTWFVISPKGANITAGSSPAGTPTPTPKAAPTTSGYGYNQ
jgi:predicted lipoprotein with Yx(FWY)xxD motif